MAIAIAIKSEIEDMAVLFGRYASGQQQLLAFIDWGFEYCGASHISTEYIYIVNEYEYPLRAC